MSMYSQYRTQSQRPQQIWRISARQSARPIRPRRSQRQTCWRRAPTRYRRPWRRCSGRTPWTIRPSAPRHPLSSAIRAGPARGRRGVCQHRSGQRRGHGQPVAGSSAGPAECDQRAHRGAVATPADRQRRQRRARHRPKWRGQRDLVGQWRQRRIRHGEPERRQWRGRRADRQRRQGRRGRSDRHPRLRPR
jgi:hypothetical protein